MVIKEVIKKLITGSSDRFNLFLTLADIRFISVTNGNCVIALKVREEHTNSLGHLHSSFSASAVDTVGAFALRAHPTMVKLKSGNSPFSFATTDLNISYFSPIEKGDQIRVEANTIDVIDPVASVRVRILDENTENVHVESLVRYAIKR